jgi:hypothetical protein
MYCCMTILVTYGYGAYSAHQREVRGCRRDCERTLLRGRRRCAAGGREQLIHPPYIEAVACLINFAKKGRGVAAESTKFRDRK